MASEQTTSETKTNDPKPRIIYVGPKVESPPKTKNPKRVAAGKKLAALRAEKNKLLGKSSNPSKHVENECESSAVNIAYIASIFGIVAGAIAIYKWFFTGKDNDCPELQLVIHHCVERVADNPPSPKSTML